MADTTKLGKIFIGGLSYETTDEKLRSYFGAYGTVTDAVVMKDPISRRSRGFGFITYADPVCVDRALAQPNHVLDSRRVEAKRAVPRAESTRDVGSSSLSSRGIGTNLISSTSVSSAVGATKKIFVGGLHYETKDADFKKYFMQYGKVVSAEVMFNRETNKSRGFGFVIFESEVSVELVLQEKNHVLDGKSVEVKRAVPRTDIPPPRSVSSRGDSFSGPSGPGSVGSLDDVCSTTTPPVSLSGSVPSVSSFSAAMGSDKMCRATPASANLMPNGMLRGYAAAVRYGGQGVSKASSSNAVLSSSSLTSNSDTSSTHKGMGFETSSVSGVADALSSLVLGDRGASCGSRFLGGNGIAASPPLSASSSRGSSDHLFDSGAVLATNGHRSPLDSALHLLDSDPVIEQWKLSPSSGPQRASEAPLASCFESSYLPHGLVDDSAESMSNLSWQAAPWQQQQSWGSPPLPRSQQQQLQHQHQPPLPPTPTSLFSMFSNRRSGGTPLHGSSAWQSDSDGEFRHDTSTAAPDSDGFGSRTMGMGMSIDGGFVDNGVSPDTFGLHSERGNSASYRMSGGYLQQGYLPSDRLHGQQHQGSATVEHPLDSTQFERSMNGEVPSHADESRKEPSPMDYNLPSSAAEFHREFR
uniref:RRM domain-containing protein n=1 Tax=Peronospora matthiolae TaxID=2874970 RepID=A0AAV1V914_9STRA